MHEHETSDLDRDPRRRSDAGFTLLETMTALTISSLGIVAVLLAMATASDVDTVARNRAKALRAAASQMERIEAFDYAADIQNFIDYWTDPANQTFAVEGLPAPAAGGPTGTIAVDATDRERIQVLVSVQWMDRAGAQTFALPFVVTEIL